MLALVVSKPYISYKGIKEDFWRSYAAAEHSGT